MGSKKGKRRQDRNEQPEKKTGKGMMISEEHLMDKSHMDSTNFSPYLPTDALYPPYNISPNQIRTMLLELNYLLYIDFKNFWATLLYNPTVKYYLATSLQYFHRRWMNSYLKAGQIDDQQSTYKLIKFESAYQYTEALFQVTLTIFYRIIKFNEQNQDLSRIYNLKYNISYKYIFDIPKLLDLIEIYGDINPTIVKIIVKEYVKIIDNFFALFKSGHIDLVIKNIHRNVFELKIISEREQFGINYSYQRRQQNVLSPGQQQLKRKVHHLMRFLSFHEMLRSINNFFPENCIDYLYYNHEIHFIMENMFYELEVALKVWDWHQSKQKLLPMINQILMSIRNYFVQFFKRCDDIFLLKSKLNTGTIDAYLICFDRIIKDYGKRASLGKKAANKRSLILFREINKQYNIIDFLQRLYLYTTMQQDDLKINIDCLIDFKVSLQDELKKHNMIEQEHKEEQNQEPPQQLQQEEKTMAGENNSQQQQQQQQVSSQQAVLQQIRKKSQEIASKPIKNKPIQSMQILVPKKSRQDDYYTKLYKDFQSKIMINYDDEYDDLVDYEKKPLFLDEQSSNSGSDSEQQKSHLAAVANMSMVKRNSVRNQKSNKIEQKIQKPYYRIEERQMKKTQNQYSKQSKQPENVKQKPKYVDKNQKKIEEENNQIEPVKCSAYDDEPTCQQSRKIEQTQPGLEQSKPKQPNQQFYKGKKHYKHHNTSNTNYQEKGPKGGNKNKKKYVQK